MNIEESYVSFETAKLLKEKGFNEACWSWYHNGNNTHTGTSRYRNSELEKYDFSKATLAHAMKWLREVHNIHIDICSIWDTIHWLYQVFVITPRTARNSYVDKILYTSYEQAVEAAIQYSLENLL